MSRQYADAAPRSRLTNIGVGHADLYRGGLFLAHLHSRDDLWYARLAGARSSLGPYSTRDRARVAAEARTALSPIAVRRRR